MVRELKNVCLPFLCKCDDYRSSCLNSGHNSIDIDLFLSGYRLVFHLSIDSKLRRHVTKAFYHY